MPQSDLFRKYKSICFEEKFEITDIFSSDYMLTRGLARIVLL